MYALYKQNIQVTLLINSPFVYDMETQEILQHEGVTMLMLMQSDSDKNILNGQVEQSATLLKVKVFEGGRGGGALILIVQTNSTVFRACT